MQHKDELIFNEFRVHINMSMCVCVLNDLAG